DTLNSNHNLVSVQTNSNAILFVWQEGVQLVSSRTSDYGQTWSDTTIITNRVKLKGDANLLKMENGRLLLTYKYRRHQLKYSDDDGLTWSEEIELPTSERNMRAMGMYQSNLSWVNNKAWFTYASEEYNSNKRAYKLESSDGITWDAPVDTLFESDQIINFPSVINGKNDSLFLIYLMRDNIISGDIFQRTSTDNGNTWSSPIQITFTENNCSRPKTINDNNGDMYLFYELKTETQYPDYQQTDICFSKLEEINNNWSTPQSYTKYIGDDLFHNASTVDGKVFITSGSDRILNEEPISYEPPVVEYHNSWYGFLDSEDLFTPPILYSHTLTHFVNSPDKRSEVVAYGLDDNELNSITLFYSIDDNDEIELELFDDGLHFDSEPNDNIFGNEIKHDSLFDIMKYQFILEDNRSIVYRSLNRTDETFFDKPIDKYYFEINKIGMPMRSSGILADVRVGSRLAQGRYDEASFLYSGGFMMSGYSDTELWANAAA
ncbi:MAG: exo-alpha-sialidase, partial [Melioribacteraceae bacterium]|nr:exo-alpha-sialidase [Melioribacteraceae bacterium]